MKRLSFLKLLKITIVFLFVLCLLLFIQQPISVCPKNSPVYSNLIKEDCVPKNYNYIATNQVYIDQETTYYLFPNNSTLKNYTLATGGKPLQNIIITSWRSGSTFLGDIINAVPGNFYHFEPLLEYGSFQIRGPPYGDEAVKIVKNLLHCDFTNVTNYLNYCKGNDYYFTCNKRLWDMCKLYPMYCYDPTFLNNVCKLYPFHSMKLVRLRLHLAEQLLTDKSLNVRVILLVRDPRGTLQSRIQTIWCPETPDCEAAEVVCEDMISDYKAAVKLKKLYPTRFRVIRYEDLSVDPYKHAEEILDFFQLYFHSSVKAFLDTHTKIMFGGRYSTFRNSKTAPFHWRTDLKFSEVQYIEKNCDQAMQLWGYVKALNKTHLREFNPITSYTLEN